MIKQLAVSTGLALMVSLAAPMASQAVQDEDGPGFSVLELADNLDFLRANTRLGNPSTLLYRGSDFVLVVDPGLSLTSEALGDRIEAVRGEAAMISVTTHAHRDHMDATLSLPRPLVQLGTDHQFAGLDPMPEVVRFAVDGEFVLGQGEVRIGVFPNAASHTGGDLWIHFPEAGVLAVGDHFFFDRYPIIDIAGGGDPAGYFANIDWMVETFPAETRIVPGHSTFGPAEPHVATLDELAAWAGELRNSVSVIRQMAAQGLSEDEIIEAGLGPRFAPLNANPRFVSEERWIRFVLANPPSAGE